jgi:hypothetical protein
MSIHYRKVTKIIRAVNYLKNTHSVKDPSRQESLFHQKQANESSLYLYCISIPLDNPRRSESALNAFKPTEGRAKQKMEQQPQSSGNLQDSTRSLQRRGNNVHTQLAAGMIETPFYEYRVEARNKTTQRFNTTIRKPNDTDMLITICAAEMQHMFLRKLRHDCKKKRSIPGWRNYPAH